MLLSVYRIGFHSLFWKKTVRKKIYLANLSVAHTCLTDQLGSPLLRVKMCSRICRPIKIQNLEKEQNRSNWLKTCVETERIAFITHLNLLSIAVIVIDGSLSGLFNEPACEVPWRHNIFYHY